MSDYISAEKARDFLDKAKKSKGPVDVNFIARIREHHPNESMMTDALDVLKKCRSDEATDAIGNIGRSVPRMAMPALNILKDREDTFFWINHIGHRVPKVDITVGIILGEKLIKAEAAEAKEKAEAERAREEWKSFIRVRGSAPNLREILEPDCMLEGKEKADAERLKAFISIVHAEKNLMSLLQNNFMQEAKGITEAELGRDEWDDFVRTRDEATKLEVFVGLAMQNGSSQMIAGISIKDMCQRAANEAFTPEKLRQLKGDTGQWLLLRSILARAQDIVPGLRVSEMARTAVLGAVPQPGWVR